MSTIFAILSKQYLKVFTVCHSEQSDQGLHYFPISAVWSGPTLFSILSSLISVCTICYSQSDQRLNFLLFSAVWSASTLFAILSKQYYHSLHYSSFSAVFSGSTLLAILSSLIKVKVHTVILRNSQINVFTICSSQQNIMVYTVCQSQQSDQNQGPYCNSQQSDPGLHSLPFSVVWSGSSLFYHSQQSKQGLHYLPLSVWSGSTLFANLSILIRV